MTKSNKIGQSAGVRTLKRPLPNHRTSQKAPPTMIAKNSNLDDTNPATKHKAIIHISNEAMRSAAFLMTWVISLIYQEVNDGVGIYG
jgi:hypothetical protein